MKVLHVINSLGTGGAEKLLVETLPQYAEQDSEISVDLLLLNGTKTPFKNLLLEKFSGKIFSLGTGSVYNPLHVFGLFKYLNNYDIIHVHLFPALYFVSIAKFLTRSKTKLIFTEHSTNNRRVDSVFFRIFDRIIYKNYSLITAITPEVKHMLEDKLKLKNRIVVIYNGVNPDKIISAAGIPKSEFFKQEDSKILIQVSRFSVQKDQKTLIRALDLLPPDVKLLLVGEGVFQKECEKLVEELNLTNRVRFLGVRMDVPELLKTSDIVIQSSVWEGFGLAAVEGMAAGRPVIASNVPGLKEVVEGAGLLFQKGDEKALAAHVINLLDDDFFYQKVAKLCMDRADKFDLKNMVSQIINSYKNVQI
ncbi:hypothetical protein TH53_02460 [Pedobacter lusitanus]|uniref:Glycosyltransferase n=1 Tax=Pedobacter lusitanus TaxID=1503925 RepID=A0A0D0GR40_9SPHI|nr:hypothetical protein TH53_02460 [Pedobacter lusitanus]